MNPAGGSGEEEGRDSWCTPKWLAELIGLVWLDPCSNGKSHVRALSHCFLELGDDGLHQPEPLASNIGFFRVAKRVRKATANDAVFVNPPYARGQVRRWIRHYSHTRFIFLLRWDPSTAWFAELMPHCTHVWFPNRRINFEPPPGVKSSSNPFPHALYLSHPGADLRDRLATAGYLLPVDKALLGAQSVPHGKHQRTDRAVGDGAGCGGVAEAAGPGGEAAQCDPGWCTPGNKRHEGACFWARE